MTDFVRVFDDIRLNWEINQSTILVLLDFIKAFDSVCHGLFILKLRQRLSCLNGGAFFILFFSLAVGIKESVVVSIFGPQVFFKTTLFFLILIQLHLCSTYMRFHVIQIPA
jgi:hypothetical protein